MTRRELTNSSLQESQQSELVELQDVAAFLAVVRHSSFTKAAQHLGVAKSGLSRRVSRLEQQLDARLLERTTRSLHLTEVGETYFDQATEAMARLDEANAAVRRLHDRPTGHLRISAPADMADLMARLAVDFTDEYPDITVEFISTQRYVDLIAEGIDAAFRAGRLEDSSLIARKIDGASSLLFASSDYIAEHGTPMTPEELAEHRCVLFKGHRGRQTWELQGPRGTVNVEVQGSLSGTDFNFVRRAVRSGAGIGMIPAMTNPEQHGLVRVLPDHGGRHGVLYFVHPSARFPPAKLRAFREFSIAWIRKEIRALSDD